MQIISLMLFATMPMQEIHRRSYKTSITPETFNVLDNATRGGTTISQAAISQVATNLIAPSAESEGVATIVNGWATPRFRFVMKVLEGGLGGSQNIAYYIGHTNYSEGSTVTLSGNRIDIDPQLQFHVNSVHRIKLQQLYASGVHIGNKPTINHSAQIIYGSNTVANMENNLGLSEYKIRPIDIFENQNVLNGLNSIGAIDGYNYNSTGQIIFGAETSSNRNKTPGTYIYDTLNAYRNAKGNLAQSGQSLDYIAEEATGMFTDGNCYTDPLFSFLRDNIRRNIQHTGQFSWGELLKIAPHMDDITQVFTPSDISLYKQQTTALGNNLLSNTWGVHNTHPWGGSDSSTVAASLLAQSVPAIVLENLGGTFRANFTNNTHNGQIESQLVTFKPIDTETSIDVIAMAERIMERIKIELFPIITANNNILTSVVIDCTVFGDTMVHISLNGDEYKTYVMPTFADNTASPVITLSQQRYNQVTNDIYNLANELFNRNTPLNFQY